MKTKKKKFGGLFNKLIDKTKTYLQKSKILSEIGNLLLPLAGEFTPIAKLGLDKLKKEGYGKSKRRIKKYKRGGALIAVGGSNKLMSKKLNPIRRADTSALQFRY